MGDFMIQNYPRVVDNVKNSSNKSSYSICPDGLAHISIYSYVCMSCIFPKQACSVQITATIHRRLVTWNGGLG